MSGGGLTEQGRHLRAVAAHGNESVEPWGFVPCAAEHEPGRLCILPDGHAARVVTPEPVTGHDSHQHRDTSGHVITLCTTCNRAFVNEDAHQAWVKEQT